MLDKNHKNDENDVDDDDDDGESLGNYEDSRFALKVGASACCASSVFFCGGCCVVAYEFPVGCCRFPHLTPVRLDAGFC